MNITINIATLLNVLYLVLLATGITVLLVLDWKKRKLLRGMRQQWLMLPPQVKATVRTQTLFEKPLADHAEHYPKDVKVLVSFLDCGESQSVLGFHHQGLDNLTVWSEGNGLDLMKLLVKGLSELEAMRPGAIPVLQVMLDAERDKVNGN